jgi:UDP-N-acetylmuramate dehydrogenase
VKTEKLKIIFEEVKCEKRFDEPMRRHTSFRIGGDADLLIFPDGTEDLKRILYLCKRNRISLFVIGFGTNLLVKDGGIRGVVVSLRKGFKEIRFAAPPFSKGGMGGITAGAGAGLKSLINFAIKNELSGMEFAAGIPGSVGGALVMNAGTGDGEMKDVVQTVNILTADGRVETLKKEDIKFSYRNSEFPSGSIILQTELILKNGKGGDIRKAVELLVKSRKSKQPLSLRSAGSVFKNPSPPPFFKGGEDGISAGRLIESTGLKGFNIGDAVVSEKHANFIINRGNAAAKDVLKLVEVVKERVFEKAGVSLEEEIKIVGEDE